MSFSLIITPPPLPPSAAPSNPYATSFGQHSQALRPLSTRDPNIASSSPHLGTFHKRWNNNINMGYNNSANVTNTHKIHPPSSLSSSSSSAAPPIGLSSPSAKLPIPSPVATINKRASKDSRRESYFNKIRDRRDHDRFEVRGDQVLRMEFELERQRWEERIMRSAPDTEATDVEGDSFMEEGQDFILLDDEEEADYDGDLSSLAFGETEAEAGGEGTGRDSGSDFYDEEYQEIFTQIAGQESRSWSSMTAGWEGVAQGTVSSGYDLRGGDESEFARTGHAQQDDDRDTDMTDG